MQIISHEETSFNKDVDAALVIRPRAATRIIGGQGGGKGGREVVIATPSTIQKADEAFLKSPAPRGPLSELGMFFKEQDMQNPERAYSASQGESSGISMAPDSYPTDVREIEVPQAPSTLKGGLFEYES